MNCRTLKSSCSCSTGHVSPTRWSSTKIGVVQNRSLAARDPIPIRPEIREFFLPTFGRDWREAKFWFEAPVWKISRLCNTQSRHSSASSVETLWARLPSGQCSIRPGNLDRNAEHHLSHKHWFCNELYFVRCPVRNFQWVARRCKRARNARWSCRV